MVSLSAGVAFAPSTVVAAACAVSRESGNSGPAVYLDLHLGDVGRETGMPEFR